MGVFPTLEAKIAAWALIFTVLILGYGFWHHHVYAAGAASVQTAWDKQKSLDAAAAVKAQAQADVEAGTQRKEFNRLAQKYEDLANAQPPSVADTTSAAVSSGTLRLRDEPAAVCPDVSAASAAALRSRAADAAATQALADRVADSVRAVSAGDAADARERQLDAQIVALQGVLTAERAKP